MKKLKKITCYKDFKTDEIFKESLDFKDNPQWKDIVAEPIPYIKKFERDLQLIGNATRYDFITKIIDDELFIYQKNSDGVDVDVYRDYDVLIRIKYNDGNFYLGYEKTYKKTEIRVYNATKDWVKMFMFIKKLYLNPTVDELVGKTKDLKDYSSENIIKIVLLKITELFGNKKYISNTDDSNYIIKLWHILNYYKYDFWTVPEIVQLNEYINESLNYLQEFSIETATEETLSLILNLDIAFAYNNKIINIDEKYKNNTKKVYNKLYDDIKKIEDTIQYKLHRNIKYLIGNIR